MLRPFNDSKTEVVSTCLLINIYDERYQNIPREIWHRILVEADCVTPCLPNDAPYTNNIHYLNDYALKHDDPTCIVRTENLLTLAILKGAIRFLSHVDRFRYLHRRGMSLRTSLDCCSHSGQREMYED